MKPRRSHQAGFDTLSIYGEPRRIQRIYLYFILVTLLAFIPGSIILLSHGDLLQVVFMSIATLFVLSSYLLVRKNKFEHAAVVLVLVLFALITLISTYGLGIHAITVIGLPSILIIASLVARKRTLVLLFLFAAGCIAWLVFGELGGLYAPMILRGSVPGDFITVMVILTATLVMVRILTETLFHSHRELQKELNERIRAEERLAYDALHDALTRLPNRSLFNDRLEQRFEHTRRHPEEIFAVLIIDLDRFKVVNDSLGHAIGDQLLVETAGRLAACVRADDTVARLGGDEFAILLNEFNEIGNAVHVAERVQSGLMSTSMIEGYNRVTTASIGITVYSEKYSNPPEMLRDADSAMYRAKSRSGAQYAIFDDSMHANAMTLLQMEADLKHALENREFVVYYQPVVNLPGQDIAGMEALARWNHPRRGLLEPADFIPVAEETGLILPLGEFVLGEACRQAKSWREGGNPALVVSVNLSGRQFQDKGLLLAVKRILAETGLPGSALQLEITESVAMKDLAFSNGVLSELDRLGIEIALDDFGNGYSSFGYLHSFPIRVLKIDQAFIRGIGKDASSETITRAIISLSHSLELQVTAEGVETEKQLSFLGLQGCDQVQGYLTGRPMPAAELQACLE